jgi:hypothetical protein
MMKHLVLLLLAAAFLATGASAQTSAAAAAWTKHDSAKGKFSVMTPCAFEPGTETAPEPDSDPYHSCSASGGYFVVSYADLPAAPESAKQSLLDAMRDGLVKGLKAQLLSEKKIVVGANPAREIVTLSKIDNADYVYKWRVFVNGVRAYSVGVGTLKANAASPNVDKFLTSFAAK